MRMRLAAAKTATVTTVPVAKSTVNHATAPSEAAKPICSSVIEGSMTPICTDEAGLGREAPKRPSDFATLRLLTCDRYGCRPSSWPVGRIGDRAAARITLRGQGLRPDRASIADMADRPMEVAAVSIATEVAVLTGTGASGKAPAIGAAAGRSDLLAAIGSPAKTSHIDQSAHLLPPASAGDDAPRTCHRMLLARESTNTDLKKIGLNA